MISSHKLTVHKRERTGSRYSQRERAAGRLPAVLYGHGQAPVSISLDAKEALRFFHDGEKVFSIDLEGEQAGQTVMLKDLQFDYLGTNVVHVDLTRVDINESIEANVPVHFHGDAVGLKTANTILVHPTSELHVRCTVATLPDSIVAEIGGVEAGSALHAGQLQLPEGVELLTDPDAVVAQVNIVKEEVEEPEGEAAEVGAEGAAEPEVIGEKKADEGEGGKDESA